MDGKVTSRFNLVANRRKSDVAEARPGANAYPRLLGGKKLKGLVLPADFDTSVHHAAKTSKAVKATPLSKLADRIASLEKGKQKVG